MYKKTIENTQKNMTDTIYDEVISKMETDTEESKKGIRIQEPYQYINFERIKKDLKITAEISKKGDKLIKKGELKFVDFTSGYLNSLEMKPACSFDFVGIEDFDGYKDEINVSLLLSKNRALSVDCDCSECYGNFFWSKKTSCKYVAAALNMASEYLKSHRILMDATDLDAKNIIESFSGKKRSKMISESRQQENSLILTPRIVYKDDDISLSFKIGDGGKDYVIKDLVDFAELVNNSGTKKYGNNKIINHGIQNFSKESKKWVDFILDCTAEEKRIRSVIEEEIWKKYSKKIANIELYGWRMDKIYNFACMKGIHYENRESKKKLQLKCIENNPKLKMAISPIMDRKTFDGIKVLMQMPDMYIGTENVYYIDENKSLLCKATPGFYDKMEPFISRAHENVLSIEIGRANISEFYYNILPEISDYVDIFEEKAEIIEQYLLPETKFNFYLDADNGDVDCKVQVEYGDKKFSCLDNYRQELVMENYRLLTKEKEVLYFLEQLFPVKQLDRDRLSCGGDENRIYDVISSGVEKLTEYGNVYCTKRFKNVKTRKSTKLNVGVSVSGGMLELELLTQDMTEDELLELLKNYKKQNKYYRFKSGDFIEVEDSALQMLFEMMETMHMTPKQFVKGKMHLPLYRTLYLDKMLENHREVYNTRDQQFKSIIKNMKSISEADYEVPEKLDMTMRNYQKYGFKWMKTLENCGFGGILADDMGLGKTLQTIAVLLDAKENGVKGTSLIVSPASLVYNWAEEFEKFAPEIRVQILGGSASERSEIIEKFENADVLVTSYDILKRDIAQYDEKQFLYEIIDEAQYIKNPTTAAAKAVKVINSKVRFALTGTPIENRLSELWSIFDYLMPGFLYTYDIFKKEYENPIVKYDDEEKLTRLQKIVKPFIMRRLKKDVLKDLPDKLEETRVVRLEGEQSRLYDAQVVHMKNELAKSSEDDFKKDKLRILAEITRLRQICCDPNLCYNNYKGSSAKLESCMELIESAISSGHKMLLFSQFTSMLTIIENALSGRKIKYYKITGETAKQNRLNMVKQFNEDETPVFLISLKAGGVGLNLTGADMVIHYDPWWNVAVQNQATDRAHRIGQTKKVTVYKMIAKGTIEEKIVKLQETKKNLADNIVNGENIGIGSMSKEDLMELLGID